VFCTSTDGGILSKYSQDIAAKPPQEPRMIATIDTMGLVPNNGGVGKSSLSLVNWIENLAPTKGGSNFSMMLSG
jgi:hypothetical protein